MTRAHVIMHGICVLVFEQDLGECALYDDNKKLVATQHAFSGEEMAIHGCRGVRLYRANEEHDALYGNCQSVRGREECEFVWPERFSEEWTVPASIEQEAP